MSGGFFFNGQVFVTPGVMSAVDDSALFNTALANGQTLAVLGSSGGGQPKVPLQFTDPAQAVAALVSGPLATIANKLFAPSPDAGSPASIIFMRVDGATQSALPLKDTTAASSILLTSVLYGTSANGITVKLEAASGDGLSAPNPNAYRATLMLGAQTWTQDNVGLNALKVTYGGTGATPIVAVSSTNLILSVAAVPVASFVLANFATIGDLAAAINTVPDFTAQVSQGTSAAQKMPIMDVLSSTDPTAGIYLYANRAALCDWFNAVPGSPVTAQLATGANILPPTIIGTTQMSGGTVTAPTTQDWSDALTALQEADCQFVVPLIEDLTVWDMLVTHCEYMSTVAQKERRAFVGGLLTGLPITPAPTGTINTLLATASLLDSDRVALVAPGVYLPDLAGNLALLGAEYAAAITGAAFSALAPGETLTHKRINVLGLDTSFALPGDTDRLIQGGVLCFTKTKQGFTCAKACSTWQGAYFYDKVEISVGVGYDYVARTVREGVDDLVGQIGGPIGIGLVASRVDTILRGLAVPKPQGPGVLVGDAQSPPFRNILVTLTGDVVAVSFEASVGIPMNFISVTIYARAYSGSVTLAAPAPLAAT